MIDHVHGEILGMAPETIRNNPRLRLSKYEEKRHVYDKNVTRLETYENELVTFTIINETKVLYRFSLHKFAHQGKNDSDFSMRQVKYALTLFAIQYHVNLKKAVIHGIEFGVNIHPPDQTLDIIKRIGNYKGKPFTRIVKGENYDFLLCDRQRFSIKIYDKARQYRLLFNLLRYELRIKKMSKIHSSGIANLADLMKPEKLYCLGKVLFKTFNAIEIIPKVIDHSRIKERDLKFIQNASRSDYFTNPHLNSRRKLYEYQKYMKLIKEYSQDQLQKKFEMAIKRKWFTLLFGSVNGSNSGSKNEKLTKINLEEEFSFFD